MNLHRCTETDCPVFGHPSTRGCLCHRTDVEILTSQRDELLEALKELHLQALQSDLNSPANEWGYEAIQRSSTVITKLQVQS